MNFKKIMLSVLFSLISFSNSYQLLGNHKKKSFGKRIIKIVAKIENQYESERAILAADSQQIATIELIKIITNKANQTYWFKPLARYWIELNNNIHQLDKIGQNKRYFKNVADPVIQARLARITSELKRLKNYIKAESIICQSERQKPFLKTNYLAKRVFFVVCATITAVILIPGALIGLFIGTMAIALTPQITILGGLGLFATIFCCCIPLAIIPGGMACFLYNDIKTNDDQLACV